MQQVVQKAGGATCVHSLTSGSDTTVTPACAASLAVSATSASDCHASELHDRHADVTVNSANSLLAVDSHRLQQCATSAMQQRAASRQRARRGRDTHSLRPLTSRWTGKTHQQWPHTMRPRKRCCSAFCATYRSPFAATLRFSSTWKSRSRPRSAARANTLWS
jgi:hypothetical protein